MAMDVGMGAVAGTGILSDSLGDEFMANFSPSTRRASGSTYTPLPVVRNMVEDAAKHIDPDFVVDCGCGSGRFALAAAMRFPSAKVYAVDNSELACTMCAENVRRYGLADRVVVVNESFMDFTPPERDGRTLWIGNPPYVRHHQIGRAEKERFKAVTDRLALPYSGLAGLHVHFIAHVAECWHDGDYCTLLTGAEWLDANYGATVRFLLTERLPLVSMRLFDPETRLFEGTDSTAVIISFSDASSEGATVTMSDGLTEPISLAALRGSGKWTRTIREARIGARDSDGLVTLGSIASVHRGVVTGNNKFWVRPASEVADVPMELKTPIVAHAREIMNGCVANGSTDGLGMLLTLPPNLNLLSDASRNVAQSLIDEGRESGVDRGYVASSRRPWWSVRAPKPPAIMMTYMARHSPTFILNELGLPMLNVVHGIYPRTELSEHALRRLVGFLNENVSKGDGRVYCGGLAKFEPREAEGILVPPIEQLEA